MLEVLINFRVKKKVIRCDRSNGLKVFLRFIFVFYVQC
jgi:hypothetical protein